MKKMRFLLLLLIGSQLACSSQNQAIESYYYKAQTRGFQLEIFLNKSALEITKNGTSNTISLTEKQVLKAQEIISSISFESIKSNLSVEDAAVDKVVPAYCKFTFEKDSKEFDFNHGKLPEKIEELNSLLLKYGD